MLINILKILLDTLSGLGLMLLGTALSIIATSGMNLGSAFFLFAGVIFLVISVLMKIIVAIFLDGGSDP